MTGFGPIRATRKAAVLFAIGLGLLTFVPARAETLPEVLPDVLELRSLRLSVFFCRQRSDAPVIF